MDPFPPIVVLRLGHRPGRDERMTTHVGLTARALGADRMIIGGGDGAGDCKASIDDVTARFGGSFAVDRRDDPGAVLRDWTGSIVHLTMYGLPIQDVESTVREETQGAEDPLLVVVGAEKVTFDVYEAADWNVAVTNQPHSEVAGLAVFLDRLFEGRELDREFDDASVSVVPMRAGKRMVSVEAEPRDDAESDRP